MKLVSRCLLLTLMGLIPFSYGCLWHTGASPSLNLATVEDYKPQRFADKVFEDPKGKDFWESEVTRWKKFETSSEDEVRDALLDEIPQLIGMIELYKEIYKGIPAKTIARSQVATALLHTGKNKEALAILQDLEKKEPGHYLIAANLGTAYELNGDNKQALKWISEGVARNKDSHYGTEWLHEEILRIKIKNPSREDFPNFLNLDLKNKVFLKIPEDLNKKNLNALLYQIHERRQFVQPPDMIMGYLIAALAHYKSREIIEYAPPLLKIAIEYEPPYREAFESQLVWIQRVASPIGDFYRNAILYIYAAILLIGSLIMWWNKKRRKALTR